MTNEVLENMSSQELLSQLEKLNKKVQQQKEANRRYYEKNKQMLNKKRVEKRNDNPNIKLKINEKQRVYYHQNRDKIIQRRLEKKMSKDIDVLI